MVAEISSIGATLTTTPASGIAFHHRPATPGGPSRPRSLFNPQPGWRHRQKYVDCSCARSAAPEPFTLAHRTLSMIISILITFLVIILILYLVNMLPIDGRAKQIVRVVVIVLGIISMLKYLAVF
jgi:hypothetical protein